MAKSQVSDILKNHRGQSVVEYVLLLAVISAIGMTFLNNKNFKEFVSGEGGLFYGIRRSMAYSYRYGRELNSEVNYDEAMNFSYGSNKHDTYFNTKENTSRFFGGIEPYGKKN